MNSTWNRRPSEAPADEPRAAPPSTTDETTGRLDAIWIKRVRRGPMDPVASAQLVADHGLEGNANVRGKRQVTLIAADAWAAVEAELGRTVDPRTRRANLLVAGLDLANSRGRSLWIGDCHLQVRGETRPCRLMEESVPGLQAALDPDWRGGVFAQVVTGGTIQIGDPVRWG